jgi:hypothetical protein
VTADERVAPTSAEILKARKLLNQVPVASYQWTGDAGKRFIEYIEELAARGVPTSWLASHIGMDATRLYVVLNRHRARKERQGDNVVDFNRKVDDE